MFYVYTYTDPTTGQVIYVGKGHGNRDKFHLHNRKTHYNKGLGERLDLLVSRGVPPVIERVFETMDEEAAFQKERELIILHGRLDLDTGSLYNRTTGGEGYGLSGSRWSDETRVARREAYAVNPRGTRYDQYTLLGELVASGLSRVDLRELEFSISTINAINACANGKRFSANGFRWCRTGTVLANVSGKGRAIEQVASDQITVIATYPSIQEAARQTSINASDINQCILGHNVTAGSFYWKPFGKPIAKLVKGSTRSVQQFSIDGTPLTIFPTMTEAANASGTSVEEIGRAAIGIRKTAGGYIWKYVDEEKAST